MICYYLNVHSRVQKVNVVEDSGVPGCDAASQGMWVLDVSKNCVDFVFNG